MSIWGIARLSVEHTGIEITDHSVLDLQCILGPSTNMPLYIGDSN